MSKVANKEILKQVSMIPAVRYKSELKVMRSYGHDDGYGYNVANKANGVLMLVVGLIVISVGFMTAYEIAKLSHVTVSTYKEQATEPTDITGIY